MIHSYSFEEFDVYLNKTFFFIYSSIFLKIYGRFVAMQPLWARRPFTPPLYLYALFKETFIPFYRVLTVMNGSSLISPLILNF